MSNNNNAVLTELITRYQKNVEMKQLDPWRVKQVFTLKTRTAAPLWFANALQASVSKEHLREEKNYKSLKRFHFQKSASYGLERSDRVNYHQQHASLHLSITNISISHFLLISLSLTASMVCKTISFNHPFFISVENFNKLCPFWWLPNYSLSFMLHI